MKTGEEKGLCTFLNALTLVFCPLSENVKKKRFGIVLWMDQWTAFSHLIPWLFHTIDVSQGILTNYCMATGKKFKENSVWVKFQCHTCRNWFHDGCMECSTSHRAVLQSYTFFHKRVKGREKKCVVLDYRKCHTTYYYCLENPFVMFFNYITT